MDAKIKVDGARHGTILYEFQSIEVGSRLCSKTACNLPRWIRSSVLPYNQAPCVSWSASTQNAAITSTTLLPIQTVLARLRFEIFLLQDFQQVHQTQTLLIYHTDS